MSQLIQIADFQFIALKDGIGITEQDRKKFASMPLKDKYFSARVVDVPTSLALLAEFEKCPFANDDFRNDLDKETPQITKTDKFVYISPSYSVKSTQIPLLLQRAGLKIKRTQLVAYLGRGTQADEPYVLVNQDGTPFETSEKDVYGRANKLTIDIYDDILALRPEEYEKYLYVKKQIESGNYAKVDKADLYLWTLTESFIARREKLDVFYHEIKHAQITIILFDYLLNNPNCKLSAIDIFKQEQDNELSAKLAEVIEAINTFNQSEDKNDLSIFESSNILQQLLQGKKIEEQEKLLSDIPHIVHQVCLHRYKKFATYYKPQFIQNTSVKLSQIPLKHLTYDSDGISYNDIRRLMFTYSVYDARTGRYINMDLSEYVMNVDVIKSDIKMIQQMYRDIVIERQQTLDERSNKIQLNIIKEAQKRYLELINKTKYRETLADLQNGGMDYMSALNFIPGLTDAKDRETAKTVEINKAKKHQINKQKTEKELYKNLNVFQKAIHKIKEKVLFRKHSKAGNNAPDYDDCL